MAENSAVDGIKNAEDYLHINVLASPSAESADSDR
jgi:hypothetical protein